MNKKPIIFFCQKILSDENRTQFNRTRFLCQRFSTHIVGIGPISSKASHEAATISLFPLGKIFKWLSPFWALWAIFRINKKYKVAFLYSTYEPLNIIISFLAKERWKLKWIADIWDDPGKSLLILRNLKGMENPLLLILKNVELVIAKKVLKHADKVVTLIAQELREKYLVPQNKILSITNGINLDYNFNKHVKKRDGIFTLFYGGTVDQIRLEGVLPCLREVLKEISRIRLVLIGYELKGGYSWIRHQFRSLGGKVVLESRGVQPYSSVVEAIIESDVCLCPYPNKIDLAPAYPLKIFDYMAVGRPVVASSLPGISKILKHGFNGLLFTPGDYSAMAELILKLYNSLELRKSLSQNAKKSVLEFDWNRIHEKILLFLEN